MLDIEVDAAFKEDDDERQSREHLADSAEVLRPDQMEYRPQHDAREHQNEHVGHLGALEEVG